ncbi:MAG: DUF3047 domain-containing protein [bacterium]
MNFSKILLLFVFLLIFIRPVVSQTTSKKILGEFEKGWDNQWIERNITKKPTRYRVVQEDTNFVLMVKSDASASALWRMLNIHSVEVGKISWLWKVEKILSKKNEEKTKLGDDYAARLFVVFQPHLISWKTRAICYVWSAKEPEGSIYKNPYAKHVGMIVIESGNEYSGKWRKEERDFIADYQKVFKNAPEMVSAVAIMVDTDNTSQNATAWFDDIILQWKEPELESEASKGSGIKMQF